MIKVDNTQDLHIWFKGDTEPSIYETVKAYQFNHLVLQLFFRARKVGQKIICRNGYIDLQDIQRVEVKKKKKYRNPLSEQLYAKRK